MTNPKDPYDRAATEAVELGNRVANEDPEADLWDVADGLLAGAVQYWLYSRQPCGDPRCEECFPINTAEQRLAELLRFTEHFAKDSEYFHSPNDANAGRA